MTLNISPPGPAGKALKTWEDKLAYLLEQEAIASGAGQRFELRKQIEEAREKIREIKGLQEPETPSGAALLHNLPYPPLGDTFTGRQEELDALEAANGTAAITQSAAISGLGGIGKTRLAVEYAWRSGNRYTAKWFVRADSPENLRRNLAALAGPELLNLPEWEDQVEDQAVAAVKRSLREHSGWLMILDNVDTPEAAGAALEVLPSLSDGRVLITTRLTTWPATVRKQSLNKLSPEEAVRFLLHRTGDGREPAADDEVRAADLAERVDGLPLALEQAAAYIIRHRMRLSEYLRAWEQERENLLQWYDPRVMQYPASVAVTWKQTFDRLSPTPAALLRLTAFLAPDPFPFEMLEQGAEHVQKAAELFCEEARTAADGKTIREAAADLADYSLITRQDGGMLVVHRMVQEVLRSQISEGRRRKCIEGVLRIVNEAAIGNPGDIRTWRAWDRLRSHVAQVLSWADQEEIVDPTGELMFKLGLHLSKRALLPEAEILMRRALEIAESHGKDHPNVARVCNSLGLAIANAGRAQEAEPLLQRALVIGETVYGQNHWFISMISNNLGEVLHTMGRSSEAESLMRRALSIDEASAESDHLEDVARDLYSLAYLLLDTNRREEAKSLLHRALDLVERAWGKDDLFVGALLLALASAEETPTEAETLLRRALAIQEVHLPSDHPLLGRCLYDLALVLKAMRRWREAEPLMRRAVGVFEKSLGLNHSRTQSARSWLDGFPLLRRDCDDTF